MKMHPDVPYSIEILGGKAAAFVRGFISYLGAQPSYQAPLRKCQEAGLRQVEELGETISIPYVSKLTKLLETSGVVSKERKGRHFSIEGDPDNRIFLAMLKTIVTEWGTSIEKEVSVETLEMRSKFLDHMGSWEAVRITSDNPLPKAAYQVAIEKFKSGQYDMVFVKSYTKLLAEVGPDEHLTVDSFTASVGE